MPPKLSEIGEKKKKETGFASCKTKQNPLGGMCEPCRRQMCVCQTDSRRLSFTGSGSAPLLHFVGFVRLVLPDDRQRVGLGVEDPVVEREVVVFREEQVEIPAGDKGINNWPVQQHSWEMSIPSSLSGHCQAASGC